MSLDLLIYGRAVLLWLAVGYRLPLVLRGTPDSELRLYTFSLLSLAVAVTVLLPPIESLSTVLVGTPSVATMLGNAMALLGGFLLVRYLHRLNESTGSGLPGGALLLGVVVGVVVALFLLARAAGQEVFGSVRLGPLALVARLVILVYIGAITIQQVRLSMRYAARSNRPALSLGLRFMALGGVVGTATVVHQIVEVWLRFAGFASPIPMDGRLIREALILTATTCIVVGFTMPAWGPSVGVPAAYRWCQRYLAYRRLYPLWSAVYRAVPQIALDPPASSLGDATRVTDVTYHLCRRLIEIRDGWLELRRYVDPRVDSLALATARQAGLGAADEVAFVEAVRLASALQAQHAGGQPCRQSEPESVASGAADVDGEAAFLCRVAHFGGSRLLRRTLAEFT